MKYTIPFCLIFSLRISVPSWAQFLDMSSPLTSTGPQRKLLGARKRCSNGSVHDQEVSQPSKYFRESSVDRLSKDERKTSKPPASNANHGKEEGCEWFENAFCSTRNISKVCQFLKNKTMHVIETIIVVTEVVFKFCFANLFLFYRGLYYRRAHVQRT